MEELQLKLFQKPGSTLDLQISRPKYRTIQENRTLSEEPLNNKFTFELERGSKSALAPILLIGSVATALLSGGMYFYSKSKYDSYKDPTNTNFNSDFNKAQNSRTISAVAAAVATGALIGYIVCKINQKNKDKILEQKIRLTSIPFSPLNQSYVAGNTSVIGLAYQF